MRFTKPAIAALAMPSGKTDVIWWDDALPGFGHRIRAGGKRTWVVQYRIGTRQHRMTLGSAAAMDLDQARAEAKRALSQVGLAISPQTEKVKAKTALAVTLGALVAQYLDHQERRVAEGTLRPRSIEETRRFLERGWKPLHALPATAIGRADVAARLNVLAKENGPVSADRARAALSALCTWAMRDGLLDANPVSATNRPAGPRSRDRVLSDAELVEVWKACRDDDHGRIVRLLVLTGQRREEVGAMTLDELDLGKALWSIPGARTKNHRPHEVPLSDAALSILGQVHRRADREMLFGQGEGAFSGWSNCKERLDARILAARKAAAEKAGADPARAKTIAPWRLHDLRRTAATRMSDIGIDPHVVEAVLNHVSGAKAGVAGTYNRSAYAKEKREALNRWAEHVTALVQGRAPNVLPMRRA
jgi:integrase